MNNEYEEFKKRLESCKICQKKFGFIPHPIITGNVNAKIVQISQAPSKTVHEKLKPFIASQRKINAKYLRTSVINTYLQGEVMYKLLGDDMHKEFINMLNNARKKANYYISRDTEKMHKQDLYDFYTIGELYRNE